MRILFFTVGASGCVGATIVNPTGECLATGSGDIECYSVSAPGDLWMLDCDHPLERTYWRVHAVDGANGVTAYLMPRPDATGLTFGICDGADADLAALFDRSGLCTPTLDAAGVELVNALPLEDALAISHALHERLVFTADAGGNIAPWPLPEDLGDACPGTSVAAACADYVAAVCDETDLGVLLELDEAQATEVAGALNDLYGIGG